jgi:nucleoside-diphosphate-sugar epimerase
LPAAIEVFVGDISEREPRQFDAFLKGADLLFHCATQMSDENTMLRTNVVGTAHLITAAQGRVKRWVQLSSVGVYGLHRFGEVREDAAMNPGSTYERTKAEADRLIVKAAIDGAFECTILRPSIVFGSGMSNRSLRQLAEMVRSGLFFFIGPSGASANYVPVDNVVDALLLCGAHPAAAGRTYNLSDWATMEDFIAAMADALGVPVPHWRSPLVPVRSLAHLTEWIPGNPLTVARVDALTGRARYPIDRIMMELGYRHRQTLPEALNAMFREPSLA